VPGSAQWVYLMPVTPGAHPLEALSVALANVLPQCPIAAIRADLNASARGLHLLSSRLVDRPETRVVLVIDQAEELFTLTADEDERRLFIDLLVTAVVQPRGPLVAVLTLRADFYDRPMQYSRLGRLVAAQNVVLLPMELAELRAAIERPAALPDVGLRFEDGLVGDLLYEVRGEPGALPLVQFTLDQLYERREGRLLTQETYRTLGGVRGALARHAEVTYQGLPDDAHRTLARALLLRLIEPGTTVQDTTRRRAPLSDLDLADAARTGQLRAVTEAFIAARLLTVLERDGVMTLEVSHWDMRQRRVLGPPLMADAGSAYAFSRDGAVLASAGPGGTIRLWDVVHRRSLGPPLGGTDGVVTSLAFSPDGATLAVGTVSDGFTGAGAVQLWDVATGQPLGHLPRCKTESITWPSVPMARRSPRLDLTGRSSCGP